jgi:hypothetical protein
MIKTPEPHGNAARIGLWLHSLGYLEYFEFTLEVLEVTESPLFWVMILMVILKQGHLDPTYADQ